METLPDLPAPFPTNDVRSRLLANHRMPAYRLRALAHCRATPDMPAPHPGSSSAYLSEEVLPRVVLHRAVADLQPLAPSDPAEGSQSRQVPLQERASTAPRATKPLPSSTPSHSFAGAPE